MSSDLRLVVRNHAHLESHALDSDRVGTPGANGFTHLRVRGFITVNLFLVLQAPYRNHIDPVFASVCNLPNAY